MGWTPGLHLNARGRRQAEYLAEGLATPVIAAIYTSPLERALETAEPIAQASRTLAAAGGGLGESCNSANGKE